MNKGEKKIDYFTIRDLKINKIFWALACSLLVIMGMVVFLQLCAYISFRLSEPGMDLQSLFPGFNRFVGMLLVLLCLLFIAFITVFLYNYTVNKAAALSNIEKAKVDSPLTQAAKDHEQQIIDLLISIAKPSAGKQHLNRAPTGQFLRALTELGYLDVNVTGANLLAWVEQVTGYKDKDDDSAHFFAAYNKPTKNDSKVIGYMQQIKQIVEQ